MLSRREIVPEQVYHIPQLQGGDLNLYVEGNMAGYPCRIIIDTGTNATMIRSDVAKEIDQRLLYVAPSVSLKTVTGDKVKVCGKLDIPIIFSSTPYRHTVFVADITDPCIIGLDFLRKYGFTLDLKQNEMRSAMEEISLFGAKEKPQMHKIFSINDQVIPPKTEYVVYGQIDPRNELRLGVVDFPEQSKNEPLVAATLVDLTRTEIRVRVANISNKTRELKKGEEIASCCPVTCIVRGCSKIDPEDSSEFMKDLIKDAELSDKQAVTARLLLEEFKDLFAKSS